MSADDVRMTSDASSVPVDPGATEVNRIFNMLQSDPTMLEQFKTLFNTRPNEKANVLLNDLHIPQNGQVHGSGRNLARMVIQLVNDSYSG